MGTCLALMQLPVLCTLTSTPPRILAMSSLWFTQQEHSSPLVASLNSSLAQAAPHRAYVEEPLVMSGVSMRSQPIVLVLCSGDHRTSVAISFHLQLSLIRT